MRTQFLSIGIMLILIATVPFMALAEHKTIREIADFDDYSSTGVYDDTSLYGLTSPGIYMVDGGWGEASLQEFSLLSLECILHMKKEGDAFSILIEHHIKGGGGKNFVNVHFLVQDQQTLHIYLVDTFNQVKNDEKAWVTGDFIGSWHTIDIIIEYTESNVDGVQKEISIEVDNQGEISKTLQTAEGKNAKEPERAWDTITFIGESGSTIVCDDIDIDTKSGDLPGVNYTFLLLAGILGLLIIMLILPKGKQKIKRGRNYK